MAHRTGTSSISVILGGGHRSLNDALRGRLEQSDLAFNVDELSTSSDLENLQLQSHDALLLLLEPGDEHWLEAARKCGALEQMAVIVLSPHWSEGQAARAIALGAHEYEELEGVDGRRLAHAIFVARARLTRAAGERREVPLMQDLLAQGPHLIWRSSPDAQIEYFNGTAANYFGFPSPETISWSSLVHEDDRERLDTTWKQARETQCQFAIELRLRGEDEDRWHLVHALARFDEGENLIGWHGTTTDIHEHKRTEQALRDSEMRLREAEEIAGLGHWSYDAETDQVHWSSQMFALFEREKHLGPLRLSELSAFIHPDDRDAFMRYMQQAIHESSPFEGDWRFRAADGEYRWLRCRTRAARSSQGSPVRLFGTAVDITDRRVAEEQLRQLSGELEDERQRLMRILDHLPVGVFIIDGPTGRLSYANAESQRLLERDDLVGQYLHDIAIMATPEGEDPDRLTTPADRLVAFGDIVQIELPFRRGDGETRMACVHTAPLRDRHGDATAGLVAFIDVTDRQRAEEALREADRRKDDFLATLAHELRNPLGAIRNGIALWSPDPTSRQEVWLRQMMDRQSRQLQRLIDDLLDVSRITRGKITLQREWLDLGEVIGRVLMVVNDELLQRRQDLSVSVPDNPILLQADPTRLEQMLVNLLSNATKYTPDGGHIEISAFEHDHEAVIQVKDNGIGIPEDALETIFEKFSQVDASIHRAHGGLGLGLTLVQELALLHGGYVEAASAGRDQGSTFTLHLPVVRSYASVGLPSTAGKAADAPSSKRILLIDDDRDFAATLGSVLERAGHRVELSYDGSTGLERCLATDPDVLLVDLALPGLDGEEVARRVRAHRHSPLIIAISGLPNLRESKADGVFDDLLPKPVDSIRLLRHLDALMAAEQPARTM